MNETPYHQQPSPGAASPPFGGAPVEPQPRRPRSRAGLITCLVIVIAFGLLLLGVVVVLSTLAKFVDIEAIQMPIPRGGNTIALLSIEGVIMDESRTIEIIDHYKESDDIRAVLVRINSPGGALGASQEIFEAIRDLRASGKTVVASMSNVAASGGYYVACAADKIYSNPGTLTGSIGVIMSLMNIEEISEKIGVRSVVIKSGKLKDVPSATREMTDEERAYLQGVIDDTHGQFIETVYESRQKQLELAVDTLKSTASQAADSQTTASLGIGPEVLAAANESTRAYLRSIADGRIMTGRQAQALGLVDALGGRSEAIADLAKMTGIAKPEIYEYHPKRRLVDLLSADARSILGRAADFSTRGPRLEYRMP